MISKSTPHHSFRHRSIQRIIVFGAGELGQLLVARLAQAGHDITVIDSSDAEFADIREKSDINTIWGELSVSTMRQANSHPADMLLAVSGDEHANIVACQLANFLGIPRTICRLYSDFFDLDNANASIEKATAANSAAGNAARITPEYFGISKAFSSPMACARKILDVVGRPIVLEEVHLLNEDAVMVTCIVKNDSPLCGVQMRLLAEQMREFEAQNKLTEHIVDCIRVAAVVHDKALSFPNGNTTIYAGDRLYVCGHKKYIEYFLRYVQGRPNPRYPRVVLSGTSLAARIVAEELLKVGAKVHVIASDTIVAEKFLREIPEGAVMHVGNSNDEDVLLEAGVDSCDSFVAAGNNEAENLLCSILARRRGAAKVISVTNKPEFIGIAPEMTAIDCAFNATQICANTILREMDCGIDRLDSRLQLFNAFLGEFEVGPKSRLLKHPLKECKLPENVVLALIYRGDNVITPNGNTVFQEGDIIAAIVRQSSEEQIRDLLG